MNNEELVRQYLEIVINQKQLDRWKEFINPDAINHGAPYGGMGMMLDDTSGDKVIVSDLFPGNQVEGQIQRGDEIVRVDVDGDVRTSYEQLRTMEWGRGKVGTSLSITVRRGGELHTYSLTRGLISGFTMRMADVEQGWRSYLTNEMPDLHSEVVQIFSNGDFVAYHAINRATSAFFGASAVWAENTIVRLKDGKMVEFWGVEDLLSQYKQLGYRIIEPAVVKA